MQSHDKNETRQKIKRAYIIAKRLEKLTETRKSMRKALSEAESSAYSAVK